MCCLNCSSTLEDEEETMAVVAGVETALLTEAWFWFSTRGVARKLVVVARTCDTG